MVALLETVVSTPRPPAAGERSDGYSNQIFEAVEQQISSALLPDSLSRVALAQFDERQGGSSVFGLLSLYAYESAGGEFIEDALAAAATVELVAAAASVLDDLQDMDPVPAIDGSQPGAGAELVALLLSLSQRAIASIDDSQIACHRVVAAQRIIADFELMALGGQHRANMMTVESRTTLADATEATHAKSGSFGRLAAEVGAALATDSRTVIEAHGNFGEHVAIIDQLQNDISGIWPGGDPSTDIELGRQTPPLVFALEVPEGVNRAADEVKEALNSRGEDGQRDEAQVRDALFRSGAVHYAWIVAAVHKAKAATIARECSKRNPNSRIGDLLAA